MKKFSVPCLFDGVTAPFNIYVGQPADDAHPLEQQAAWLARERGGVIPPEVLDSFAQLHEIARTEGVLLDEIAAYALDHSVTGPAVGQISPEKDARGSRPGLVRRLSGLRQQGGQ